MIERLNIVCPDKSIILEENSISTVIDQFDTRASTFNQSASWITNQNLVKNIIGSVKVPVGSRGIELCCGTGVVSHALKNIGMDMTGVDISPAMLKESGKHIHVTHGNVENLPFDNNSADFIVIRQALFLTDSHKVLEEVKRVLRPHGQFIVCNTVPISEYDSEYLEHIHRCKQKNLKIFYTSSSLRLDLIKHGFTINDSKFLTVQESIDRWMAPEFAPELSVQKRQEVLDLIQYSPNEYKQTRNVRIIEGTTLENWGWQIYNATPKKNSSRFILP